MRRINVQAIVTLIAGGLAGAIFNWLANRPRPTVINYDVTTTSLEAESASSVIPNLQIHIGTEEVRAIHSHNISLIHKSGPYVEEVEIAIIFPVVVRFFGNVRTETPDILHELKCSDFQQGVRCKVKPLRPRSEAYRITIATNEKMAPEVRTIAKNVELVKAQTVVTRATTAEPRSGILSLVAGFIASLIGAFSAFLAFRFASQAKKVVTALLDSRWQDQVESHASREAGTPEKSVRNVTKEAKDHISGETFFLDPWDEW
jgi:hypothetical protein